MRAEILLLLESQGGQGGLSATAVCHEVDAPNLSTATYHFRVLCQAELVKADGDAAVPVYSLA
ncbi:MAG TPA: hypothetical protein VIH47_03630 [Solirubrobacterales bacterium]